MAFKDELATVLATVDDTGARAVTIGEFAPNVNGQTTPAAIVLYPAGNAPGYGAMVMRDPSALTIGTGTEGQPFRPSLVVGTDGINIGHDFHDAGGAILNVFNNDPTLGPGMGESGALALGTYWVAATEYRGASGQMPAFPDGLRADNIQPLNGGSVSYPTGLKADTINPVTAGAPVAFPTALKSDTINPVTASAPIAFPTALKTDTINPVTASAAIAFPTALKTDTINPVTASAAIAFPTALKTNTINPVTAGLAVSVPTGLKTDTVSAATAGAAVTVPSGLKTDTINPATAGGLVAFPANLKTDTIKPYTAGSSVTVAGTLNIGHDFRDAGGAILYVVNIDPTLPSGGGETGALMMGTYWVAATEYRGASGNVPAFPDGILSDTISPNTGANVSFPSALKTNTINPVTAGAAVSVPSGLKADTIAPVAGAAVAFPSALKTDTINPVTASAPIAHPTGVKTDTINPVTASAPVAFPTGVKTDTINPVTASAPIAHPTGVKTDTIAPVGAGPVTITGGLSADLSAGQSQVMTLNTAAGWTIRSGYTFTFTRLGTNAVLVSGNTTSTAAQGTGSVVILPADIPTWARPSAPRTIGIGGTYSITAGQTPTAEVSTANGLRVFSLTTANGNFMSFFGVYPL